jgi:hypothetical protein
MIQSDKSVAYCYISAPLGPAKTLRYSIHICSLLAGPAVFSVFFRLPLSPSPWGLSFHGYRAQNEVVPERQRFWGIGSSPSVSRSHVGHIAVCTDGPATHQLRIPYPTGRRHPGATEVPGPTRCHHHRSTTAPPRPRAQAAMVTGPGLAGTPAPLRPVPLPCTPLPAPGGKPGDGTPTPRY